MNYETKTAVITFMVLAIGQIQGGDFPNNQNVHAVWLPGLKGGYGFTSGISDTSNPQACSVIGTSNNPDLGQGTCVQDLNAQLETLKTDGVTAGKKIIAIGSSQGGGTWVNKIAQMSEADQEGTIAAIILEAPLANANDAILHNMGKASYLPFAQFWASRVAPVRFRGYNARGMQATVSAKKISPRIPVIIAHTTKDPETPINSTRRLVCELLRKRQGQPNNVYYMEQALTYPMHIDFFGENNKSDFHAISKKLGLPHSGPAIKRQYQEKDFAQFQPSVEKLEKDIRNSTWKSRWTRNVIDILAFAGIAGGLYYKYVRGSGKKTA